MCVIMLADKQVRPTEEMVRQGYTANGDGVGAAWREGGKVKWVKGLNLAETQELNQSLPFPYVLHFRRSSPNTAQGKPGCHPFPVSKQASPALEGTAPDGVLFHNGFWTGWRDKILDTAVNSGYKIPGGAWTDSRGLAWLTAHVGAGVLEMINEKVIWFEADKIQVFGDGWERVNDIWVSNKTWMHGHTAAQGAWSGSGFTRGGQRSQTSTGQTVGASGTEGTGGSSSATTFRGAGSSTENQADHQAGIQTAGAGSTSEGQTQAAETRKEGTSEEVVSKNRYCMDCEKLGLLTVLAHVWASGYSRCWPCWNTLNRKSGKSGTAGESFRREPDRAVLVPAGGPTLGDLTGVAEAVCGFCRTHKTKHRMLEGDKPICSTCWLTQGRPSIRQSNGATIINRGPSALAGVVG